MSINWVMLDETTGFVPLPKERILFTSPPRTTLAIQTPNSYPGKEPLAIHSSAGTAFLTNQRLVYLPAAPTAHLKSFSAPIMNLQDAHVHAPFFGANVWTGVLQPVTGGGIPPHHTFVEIKMTFKEGGAFDFHSTYERIRESLSQAIELAREGGQMTGNSGPMAGVDLSTVHLDQLPAYEDVGPSRPVQPVRLAQPIPFSPPSGAPPLMRDSGVLLPSDEERNAKSASDQSPSSDHAEVPTEPPPGYDEVQRSSVVDNLEESIRRSQ
ncbi:MAG: hypothetical protein FRX48_05349 [Lasallia pustulata]|uniref:WW-domain-binding protein n=1 Tax=Lasallia pustulata TaxID=136370 RepID=A0A5M8PQU1_9LECA|nr:MAG: hypothetical protein FRX48_05349 [Lasallia pustulata]